jgi:hypothetical protein
MLLVRRAGGEHQDTRLKQFVGILDHRTQLANSLRDVPANEICTRKTRHA